MRLTQAVSMTALAAALAIGAAGAARADAIGTLYYTTYTPTDVYSLHYDYNGTALSLTSTNTLVAHTSGADGIIFSSNGNIIVAGQGPSVSQITTAGAPVTSASISNGGSAYHFAYSANGSLLYATANSGSGNGTISALPVTGGIVGNGVGYTVNLAAGSPVGASTSVRSVIYDPNNGTYYYGTAVDGSTTGDFGTVAFNDTTHTATLTPFASDVGNMASHGLTYDPFTKDIIANSGGLVQQINASGTVVSTLNEPAGAGAGNLDQAAVDGNGNIFVASNGGGLLFANYASTGLIGTASYVTQSYLIANLDDVAPLSGQGAQQVPEPASLLVLGTGLLGLGLMRRRLG